MTNLIFNAWPDGFWLIQSDTFTYIDGQRIVKYPKLKDNCYLINFVF